LMLSLGDRLILATIANCNDCEAGFPEEALYADNDDPHWRMYFAMEGKDPPSRAELAGRIRELIADGFTVWRHGGPIAHMLPGYSGLDSEGLALTDAGKKEAELLDSWLGDDALVSRAARFAESYIARCGRQLPFRPAIPAYLPGGMSPLPEIEIEGEQLRMTYYADDCHVIVEQTTQEQEPWLVPPETAHEEILKGLPINVKEGQMTSMWATMTFKWRSLDVFRRVTFNWINRLSTDRPDALPVFLDDDKRQKARKVVASMLELRH
jgi:hypothetical protein